MAGIYKDILDEDRQALFNISSDKWRHLNDYFTSFADGMSRRNMNHSLILNFKKDGHGCSKACEYCNWRNSSFTKELCHPSYTSLANFLKDFWGYRVTFSGGGDPLYDYENFKLTLKNLSDEVKTLGFLPCLITREYETAVDAQGLFHQISFSVDSKNGDARYAMEEIYARKIVTIVYDPARPLTFYKDLYDYFAPSVSHMIIRQDMNELWMCSDPALQIKLKRNILLAMFRAMNARVQFLPGEACLDAYYLMGKEERLGRDLFAPDRVR